MPVVPPETIKPVLSVLTAFAQLAFPRAKRLYAERTAALGEVEFQPRLLRKQVDDVLERLSGHAFDQGWWSGVCAAVGHQVVVPDFFRKPAIQSWLKDPDVRRGFRALVGATLSEMAEPETADTVSMLLERYAHHTGELAQDGSGLVDIVCGIAVASLFSALDDKGIALATLIQEVAANQSAQHSRMEARQSSDREKQTTQILSAQQAIGADLLRFEHNVMGSALATARRANTFECRKALDRVLLRRTFPGLDRCGEIAAIARQLEPGQQLEHADNAVKVEVFYWAARFHADNEATVGQAEQYRVQLLNLAPQHDTRLLDILLDEHKRNADKQLISRRLLELDTPDARAVLLRHL